MYLLGVLGVFIAVCGTAFSHTYHLGTCPVVEPMPGFEMNRVSIIFWIIFRYQDVLLSLSFQTLE